MTAVDELIRWEAAGGHWRVIDRSSGRVTVALVTCDGGEEMSRVTASAEKIEEYLGDRTTSHPE